MLPACLKTASVAATATARASANTTRQLRQSAVNCEVRLNKTGDGCFDALVRVKPENYARLPGVSDSDSSRNESDVERAARKCGSVAPGKRWKRGTRNALGEKLASIIRKYLTARRLL